MDDHIGHFLNFMSVEKGASGNTVAAYKNDLQQFDLYVSSVAGNGPGVSFQRGGYLRLDQLLSCQKPQSDEHDELLFVILHQTMELWMKQVIHELGAAQDEVRDGNLVPAYKHMARVSRIQAVMTQSWDILATMTPADYLSFRGLLGTSSGFQSYQFRALEYRLGLKDAQFLRYQTPGSEAYNMLEAALNAPSLYDDVIAQLAKAGFAIPKEILDIFK